MYIRHPPTTSPLAQHRLIHPADIMYSYATYPADSASSYTMRTQPDANYKWFRVYFRLNRTLKSIILIIIYFVYALPVHFHIIFLPASPGNMRMRLLCSGIHCWPSAAPQHDAYRIREYTTKCIIPNNN